MPKLNNLQERIIAGVIGSAATIYLLCYKWGAFAAVMMMGIFSLLEFYKLTRKNVAQANLVLGMIIGGFNLTLTFLVFNKLANPDLFILNLPAIGLVFISELYRKSETPFSNIAFTILGLIYIVLPFCALYALAFTITDGYSYQFMIGLMLLVWANDTGQYAAGRLFGKHKLFERISPKKTWEGTAGGLVLALIFAFGIDYFTNDLLLWHWISIALIIVVIGSFGDLVESLFKRSILIKDSGKGIPGHGGFLDRLDSLILALPYIATFVFLFVKNS